MTNPYAKYLGGRNPFEAVAATPARLQELLHAIGPRVTEAPAPGKWSPREIVIHLADCELAFAFRLRQTLADEHHVLQPFDQEAWAKRYDAYTAEEALAAFQALRHWNLLLLRGVTEREYERKVTHPERGEGTFRILVETMAGHDLNHIGQLEKLGG